MKNWLSKAAIVLLAVSFVPATAQAIGGPLSTAGDKDGGIGNSTNYRLETPNISLSPKVNQIISPLFASPEIKKRKAKPLRSSWTA